MRAETRGVVAGSPRTKASVGNHLLDGLARGEISKVAPIVRGVFLHGGQELSTPSERGVQMYFPIDALLWSWSQTTHTERPTSLLSLGRRGVAGLYNALDMPGGGERVVVLSPGSAWCLHVAALSTISDSTQSSFRRALLRYSYAIFAISCYRLACNSEHNVDKRLARWLLWIMDETGKPEVSLTHQQLADVAAIRRPSVSLAFSDLQRRGIVRVHHGLVQILDRERLEHETCAYYNAIDNIIEAAMLSRDPLEAAIIG